MTRKEEKVWLFLYRSRRMRLCPRVPRKKEKKAGFWDVALFALEIVKIANEETRRVKSSCFFGHGI